MLLNEKQVIKNLENALKIVSKDVNEALEETGQRGVGITKNNTPVKEGRLRNSIGYTIGSTVKGNDDSVKASGDKESVIIGTNVVYAAHVEYMATNGSQGYMLRSYNQLVPIAKKLFDTVLRRGLK